MSWRCSGKTNSELVDRLEASRIIKTPAVAQAMKEVDRADFVDMYPYEDSPQTIGYGATISAPHMHAYALDYLSSYLKPGNKVLDVGSGSGYLTACMAAMVQPSGLVIGIDHVDQLVKSSIKNISSHHSNWIEDGTVKMITGDGRLGYPQDAPYDCIHVGAASPDVPKNLIAQLKAPGRLFIPVGVGSQEIIVYTKDIDGNIKSEPVMGVIYVPLTDLKKQI